MDDIRQYHVPAHVPPELVHDKFDNFNTPGDFEAPQFGIARKLHHDAPPIFWNPTQGGYWVVTRAADILEICRDWQHFSSDPQFNYRRKHFPTRNLPAFYDPPEHTSARAIFAPVFSPGAVQSMEDDIRAFAGRLIEQYLPQGGCEFVHDIAQTFPVTIFLKLADAPLDRREPMVEMANRYTRGDLQTTIGGQRDLANEIRGLVQSRMKNPGTDIISRITQGTMMGRNLTEEEILGSTVFVFMAGLDTVASMMSFIQLYLARHPEKYQELRDDPTRIRGAVEELMRISGVVTMERGVCEEVTYKGVTFKPHDRVLLLLQVSGMDEAEVENPETVDFSRDVSKHLVFGAGIHRCLGSHLARIEIRVFLEEWIKRVPSFHVAAEGRLATLGGTVWCPDKLPLAW